MLVVSAGAAAAWSLPAPAAHFPVLARVLGICCRLEGASTVALTFDDGPHPEGTPAILDALEERQARATFFLVGEQVERWPELAAETARRGHEIALHGHRHQLLLRRRPAALARDLDEAAALIEAVTGRAPAYYRPPYGIFSSAALALVRRRGWEPMLWSRWGWDWSARHSPAAIARRAGAGLRSGDVVLLHDADHYSAPGSWRRTLAALPPVLEEIAALGASAATLSEST
ncbi:MAG TPA: polysaccharide deacetylase family protein [Gaiellaceae bacterium]